MLSVVTTVVLDDATIAGEGENGLALVARPVLGRAIVAVILAGYLLFSRLLFTLLHHEFRERPGNDPARA